MALRIESNGLVREYFVDGYASSTFTLSSLDGQGESYFLKTPLPLDQRYIHTGPYEIHFLARSDVKESQIYQVGCAGCLGRIGWIIPALSLDSADHDYAENEHFLNYAYHAFFNCVESIEESVYLKQGALTNPVSIMDIFHENTVFLVLSKEKLPEGFSIKRLAPSLLSLGYVILGNKSPSDIQLSMLESNLPTGKLVMLSQVSDYVPSSPVISTFLADVIPYEPKNSIKFFLLYQIFELLIEHIFEVEVKSYLSSIQADSPAKQGYRDILEKLREISNEKKRLNLLVSDFVGVKPDLGPLKSECCAFLAAISLSGGESLSEFLYPIRNNLIHSFFKMPRDLEHLLDGVIKELIVALPGLLAGYRPKEPRDG